MVQPMPAHDSLLAAVRQAADLAGELVLPEAAFIVEGDEEAGHTIRKIDLRSQHPWSISEIDSVEDVALEDIAWQVKRLARKEPLAVDPIIFRAAPDPDSGLRAGWVLVNPDLSDRTLNGQVVRAAYNPI